MSSGLGGGKFTGTRWADSDIIGLILAAHVVMLKYLDNVLLVMLENPHAICS